MWRMAGDTATDFSFYTKRMTLAGVYSSTLIVWLDDMSPGLENSLQFLKRQLSNVAAFGHFKKQLAECIN
jgi:ubiquinone biosynthesis protein COQ9